tara:strand:+ start:724 stop:1266 length:543 start_codon:yes stop_codon:yes gene_type:complete
VAKAKLSSTIMERISKIKNWRSIGNGHFAANFHCKLSGWSRPINSLTSSLTTAEAAKTNMEDIMWNIPTKEDLAKIPALYETEHIPLKNKIIHMHFFILDCDWWICEHNGGDMLFGFAILNGDYQFGEWGFINMEDLKNVRVGGYLEVDRDLYWESRPASEVEGICRAQGWHYEPATNQK